MSDGEFTESDAENDGLVKREAGQQLNSVLARESGQLYTKFRNYCDELGRDPSIVLGDMVLRAISDDGFAQEVAGTVVDTEKLNRGEVKREDLEMVTDIIEQFGDTQDEGDDPIDKMLEERLSAVGQGPLGGIGQAQQQSGGKDKRIEQLEREIQRLKQSDDGGEGGSPTRAREQSMSGRTRPDTDIDDLFEDNDGQGWGDDDEGVETSTVSVDVTQADPDSGGVAEDTRQDAMTAGPSPTFSTDEAEEEAD
jgi:polyhydroxyalkanoate synthesis regulator phasin